MKKRSNIKRLGGVVLSKYLTITNKMLVIGISLNWDLIKRVAIFLLGAFTFTYTIPWIVNNSLDKEYSGVDFHGYWYAGHFVRQGINPFAAIMNDPTPNYWIPGVSGSGNPFLKSRAESLLELPIRYVDGPIVSEHPVAQLMIVTPSVTAPLNLLISLFSWFSWPTARLYWMICNLIFAALIPWIALRLIPKNPTLTLLDKLLFVFIFYNFYGLRQSIVVGQQALVSLMLLILALIFRNNWIASGILLGFGISKYSVGLPVFIYFLAQKKYKVILISLLVQILGVGMLLPLKFGSPLETLRAYLKVPTVLYLQEGVYLPARYSNGSTILVVLMILVILIGLFLLVRQYRLDTILRLSMNYMGWHELNLITLIVFLITYHRVHDMPFMIFFLMLLLSEQTKIPTVFSTLFSKGLYFFLTSIIIFLLIIPSIPVKMNEFIPENWNTVDGMSTVSLILMYILSTWLLTKHITIKMPEKVEGFFTPH